MDKLRMESLDMTAQNIDRIAALFPNCITEMLDEEHSTKEKKVYKRAVNFELLKQMLSPDVVDGAEAYEFTWVGKKAAIVEANKPIRKTLRPCLEESKNWDTTENLYIEGENLEVLKLLQESYLGKVKMIYIDPPYNTGNDFIYADDFMHSQEKENEQMGMYDEDENRLFKNTDTNGRFHSDWCSMIYSRLMLARNLLAEDGVIFISIDDNEVYNMMNLCNEVFGSENFIATFPRLTTKSGKTPLTFMISHDYVLCYVKGRKDIFIGKEYADDSYKFSDEFEAERGKYNLKQPLDCNSISYSKSLDYPIEYDGTTYYPGSDYAKYMERQNGKYLSKDYAWRWSKELFDFGLKNGWIVFQNGRIYTKGYLNATIERQSNGSYEVVSRQKTRKMSSIDFISNDFSNDMAKKQLAAFDIPVKFDYPKPVDLISTLLSSYYDKNAIVMDFFSGSATVGEAVIRENYSDGGCRKFICIQLPESVENDSCPTICEIGKERIRRAGDKIKSENPKTAQDLDIGFRVFKLDDTNMKDVYYSPQEYSQDMLAGLESNIKDDRTDLDLLFGCLLDWRLPLSLPYKSEQIDGCAVHTYNGGDLIACFDANIPESVVKEIAKRKPLRAVFRDSGFASSPEKINVFEIFKLYMPENANDITKRVKVI